MTNLIEETTRQMLLFLHLLTLRVDSISLPPSCHSEIMKWAPAGEITVLLHAWGNGDTQALARLTPLVYRELYRAAERSMAHEKPGHLLQNTALVNELYLSLAKLGKVAWQDRNHFFAFCAQTMRHILVDHARSELYLKRGGSKQRVPLSDAMAVSHEVSVDLLALHEALDSLAAYDKRKSRVVELRFFGGLSLQETADVLNVSEDTVSRDWKFAKDWLLSEIDGINGNEVNGNGR